MRCLNCNEEIKNDAKFCSNCGIKIEEKFTENNGNNSDKRIKSTNMTWLKAIGTVVSGWGVFLMIVNYIDCSTIKDRLEFGIAWTFKYQKAFTNDFFIIIGGLILIGIAFVTEKNKNE